MKARKTKEEIENIETQKFCLLSQLILGVQERLDKIINLLSAFADEKFKEKTQRRNT
jgi:hypothetical protein